MRKFFILVAVVLLVGCSMRPVAYGQSRTLQISSEEQFLAEMIPHHQEAVDASLLMLNSTNPEVRQLAQGIISAQEQEIANMRSWMQAWYPNSTYRPTYMRMMPDLATLAGNARDRAYLEGMVRHHAEAISMAREAQKLKLHPDVRNLTDAIIKTQEQEIARMQAMLNVNESARAS